jgi:hypothetical protein
MRTGGSPHRFFCRLQTTDWRLVGDRKPFLVLLMPCLCSESPHALAMESVGCDKRSAGTPWPRAKVLVCRRSLRELVTPYIAHSKSCS